MTFHEREIQIYVFEFLLEHMKKNKDSIYDSVMREFPEIKIGHLFSKSEVVKAVNHLVKIGYLRMLDCSRGYDIALTKKGIERWNKRK